MLSFHEALDFCGLRDMKFRGSPFTWNNRCVLPCLVQERLDRMVASTTWTDLFSGTVCTWIILDPIAVC